MAKGTPTFVNVNRICRSCGGTVFVKNGRNARCHSCKLKGDISYARRKGIKPQHTYNSEGIRCCKTCSGTVFVKNGAYDRCKQCLDNKQAAKRKPPRMTKKEVMLTSGACPVCSSTDLRITTSYPVCRNCESIKKGGVKKTRRPYKQRRKWTDAQCIKDAQKYEIKNVWAKTRGSAYSFAIRRKELFAKCVAHMPINARDKWNEKTCLEAAKQYKTLLEWKNNSGGSYVAAHKNGWIVACKSHMVSSWALKTPKWTLEHCQQDALKYATKQLWREGNATAYNTAKKKGWLDLCSQHFIPPVRWSKEACLLEARQHSSLKEWKAAADGSVTCASAFGKDFYRECIAHMVVFKEDGTHTYLDTKQGAMASKKVCPDCGSKDITKGYTVKRNNKPVYSCRNCMREARREDSLSLNDLYIKSRLRNQLKCKGEEAKELFNMPGVIESKRAMLGFKRELKKWKEVNPNST